MLVSRSLNAWLNPISTSLRNRWVATSPPMQFFRKYWINLRSCWATWNQMSLVFRQQLQEYLPLPSDSKCQSEEYCPGLLANLSLRNLKDSPLEATRSQPSTTHLKGSIGPKKAIFISNHYSNQSWSHIISCTHCQNCPSFPNALKLYIPFSISFGNIIDPMTCNLVYVT